MRRVNSLEKTLMLGRIGGRRRGDDRGWDGWMASLTRWTWVWATPGVGDGQGGLACCDSWGHKELDTTERLNWLNYLLYGAVLGTVGCSASPLVSTHKMPISPHHSWTTNRKTYWQFQMLPWGSHCWLRNTALSPGVQHMAPLLWI